MILNFKYRLKPTKEQESALNQHFFNANQAWNHILNIKIIELNNKSFYKKSSELYKSCVEELKQRNISVNTGIIQSTLRNCEKTFQQFNNEH